jgi:hypothetical protein
MFQRNLKIALQAALLVGAALEIYEGQWIHAGLVLGILFLTVLPSLLTRKLELFVPSELAWLALAFVFASLFLGEIRDYYGRFWWWDLLLHMTSGGLLGVFGFLLVFVLNANPRVDLQMRPGFVAIFAFCFAVTIGALWEIFEFAMDGFFGASMQKPMLDDPSGLTDTMWDLIVDAVGALLVSIVGYRSIRDKRRSVVRSWIRRFIERNPKLFHRAGQTPD